MPVLHLSLMSQVHQYEAERRSVGWRIPIGSPKRLKHLLHMAALAAVKAKGELRDYFERRVAAGKRKMSVYNAIRNKLVHRMVSVMERRTAYIPTYQK